MTHPSPDASSHSPVVLLHGVGLDRTMWAPLQRLLPFDTIAVDLPGHGERPPMREPQSLRSLAEDVLQRLPAGTVHLLGFSLGALIAQHLARFSPERVANLICVSSVCRRTPAERAAVEQRLAATTADFAGSAAASIRRWYPPGSTVPSAVVDDTKRMLLEIDAASFRHAYAVFANGDQEISDELPRISAPTLAITGELDPGSTPEMSYRLAAAVANGRAVVVPGARHMLPLESAAALAAALVDFLNESEGVRHD